MHTVAGIEGLSVAGIESVLKAYQLQVKKAF